MALPTRQKRGSIGGIGEIVFVAHWVGFGQNYFKNIGGTDESAWVIVLDRHSAWPIAVDAGALLGAR